MCGVEDGGDESRSGRLRRSLMLLIVLALAAALPVTAPERGRAQGAATLNIGLAVEPFDLDPQNALNRAEITLARLLFQGLFATDAEGNILPALAREVPARANGGVSADGLRVTVRLREGQRWSDGTPLTAADIAYGILRGASPQMSAPFAYLLYPIAGVEAYATAFDDPAGPPSTARLQALREAVGVRAPDDTTLEFTLREPRPDLPWLLATWITFPVKRSVVEGSGPAYNSDWSIPGILVGNGPYVLRGWEERRTLTLEANPRYNGPAPRTGRVSLRFYRNSTDAMTAALNGEVDLADVPPLWLEQARDAARTDGARVLESPPQGTYAITLNHDAAPLNDARVRLALAKALNRAELVRGLGPSAVLPATCWIPSASEAACDVQRFDVVEARMLLAAAGFAEGGGLRPLEFVVENAADAALAEAVALQLRTNLGIEVRVVQLTFLQSLTRSPDQFDLRFSNWTADYPHPENWLDPFFAASGVFNDGGYRGEGIDHLFARARASDSAPERAALYAQIHAQVLRDVALIPWGHAFRHTYAGPRVRGLRPNVQDFAFGGDFLLSTVFVE